MIETWILCPVCDSKTRVRIREDTVLENFPLYCPKCKHETLISARQLNISVIKEPDAQTHRRRAGNAQGEFTCDYRFFFSVYDENLPRLRGNKKAVGWSR